MKVLKKIVLTTIAVFILIIAGGYIYFEQKFTPEKNYLTVKNESGSIPIIWLGNEKNVMLLPVHISEDSTTYYMQFDTGSPYTQFYSQSIKNNKGIITNNERAKTSLYLGRTRISSDQFKIFNSDKKHAINDSLKIIGTIGADILEDRKTIINFKENHIVFNISYEPDKFKNKIFDFTFKKRKIIIKGRLKGKEEKFLFDSGTSAYELLTNKEVWEDLKTVNSKIITEKANSWQNILTSYTAKCNEKIQFNSQQIPLNTVTYVEGFSSAQYSLMKFSGMTGMLGNKIFLKNCIYIDCSQHKIGIE